MALSTNPENILYDVLRKLEPTGLDGFEGLIAKLFESLTGRHFYLAHSGYQAGRDFSTGGTRSNVIAVECKRYAESTSLDARQILGELEQVYLSCPELDPWVLVASKTIDDSLRGSLSLSAKSKGIEVVTIETEDMSPGTLAALCAADINIVIEHIEKNFPDAALPLLQESLISLCNHANCSVLLSRLKENLSPASIGYDNWRTSQNFWLREQFSSETKSRAAFGQVLNIADTDINIVARQHLTEKLDSWFDSWGKSHKNCAILGEEGDGKTWAIASWLLAKLQRLECPATLFIASKQINSPDPLELFTTAVSKQTGTQDGKFWKKKLENWLSRPVGETPLALLVLDGLNERTSFDWRALIERLNVEPWKGRIGVVVTCRSAFWDKQFASLEHLNFLPLTLSPFDDRELTSALSLRGLNLSDIAESLLTLIRKPRYFDLVIRLRTELNESGDVTVERLIYEDWRDRIKRKNSLGEFSNEDFQTLLKALAEKTNINNPSLTEREIHEALSPFLDNRKEIFAELVSSGLFSSDPNKLGQFKVEKRRLIHGFGRWLAERVFEVSDKGEKEIEEAVAAMIEPHGDIDIKVAICGAAVFHSLLDRQYPESGRCVLFKTWLNGRNFDMETQESVPAYFPLSPALYIDLAEYFWTEGIDNYSVHDLLMDSFLKWRYLPAVQDIYKKAFERWLGFVHPYGFRFMRKAGEKEPAIKKRIVERAQADIITGPFSFRGYALTVVEDDGLLRLARVAIAIISHCPRQPYLRAFVFWAISRAIMDHPHEYDLVEWALRTSPDNIWQNLENESLSLIRHDDVILKQAAYRLLTAMGSAKAYLLRSNLPSNLFPVNPLYEIYKENPCRQRFYLWNREIYEKCLDDTDIPPSVLAENMKELAFEPNLPVPPTLSSRLAVLSELISPDTIWKSFSTTIEDHLFEKIEPALNAFAPYTAAKITRNIIRECGNREDMPLRQLSWHLRENLLILRETELASIKKAWSILISKGSASARDDLLSEANLFRATIENIPAKEQLALLITRPSQAWDILDLELLFKSLSSEDMHDTIMALHLGGDPLILRRTLWFISSNTNNIQPELADLLSDFLSSKDTIVRALVLEILFRSGHLTAIEKIIKSGWHWAAEHCREENYWGSHLLCKFGTYLTYAEVRRRIHPIHLGLAVLKRGLRKEEIRQFAEDINIAWTKIAGHKKELPSDLPVVDVLIKKDEATNDVLEDFSLSPSYYSRSIRYVTRDSFWGGTMRQSPTSPPDHSFQEDEWDKLYKLAQDAIKEQEEANNLWFAKRFRMHALRDVISIRPDLLDTWLTAIEPETLDANMILVLCDSFYRTLCEVLFDMQHQRASDLYKRLQSSFRNIRQIDALTGIDLLSYSLFSAIPSTEIAALWVEHLKSCVSDKELFELALIIQMRDQTKWLNERINEGLQTHGLFEQARAIVLLGFLEGVASGQFLNKYIKESPDSWLRYVAQDALKRWQKNEWAKHWFRNFLNHEDDAIAWSSFRLFRKCADRRFWIWRNDYIGLRSGNERFKRRLKFLRVNEEKIKDAIKENEKGLAETFLFQKIHKNEIWPWMELYQ